MHEVPILDHGVPNVPTRRITWSKVKKIQQAFLHHLKNWIHSVQPLFYVLQADSFDEEPFGASEVNICTIEVADEVALKHLIDKLLENFIYYF